MSVDDMPSQPSEKTPGSLLAEPEEFARDVPPAEVKALVAALTLQDVYLTRWSGSVIPGANRTEVNVELVATPPRVRLAPTELSLWFEQKVECKSLDDEAVAEIEVGVILDFSVEDGVEVDLDLAACFAETNGAFMAWPYVREAVHSMSTRLGLAPITIGILQRDVGGDGSGAVPISGRN